MESVFRARYGKPTGIREGVGSTEYQEDCEFRALRNKFLISSLVEFEAAFIVHVSTNAPFSNNNLAISL